jgi:hypothetical protein
LRGLELGNKPKPDLVVHIYVTDCFAA